MYSHLLIPLGVDQVDNTRGRRRGERTKAEDDGEASDGNEQEPGKMRRVLGCVGDITTGHKPARRGRVNPISSSSVSEVHEDRR